MTDEIGVTSSRDILEAVARGEGPDHLLVTLGYAGWGPGQLEREMADNAWLSAAADPDILFDKPNDQRWYAAAALTGIDLNLLSSRCRPRLIGPEPATAPFVCRIALGFDFGRTKRIGVAIGQEVTGTSTPAARSAGSAATADWDAIAHLIDDWRPAALVVGVPRQHGRHRQQPMTEAARRFARQLHGRYRLPVATIGRAADLLGRSRTAAIRGRRRPPARAVRAADRAGRRGGGGPHSGNLVQSRTGGKWLRLGTRPKNHSKIGTQRR